MLTFGSPRSALGAAVSIQDALTARERERADESLRVRIGLNVGEVLGHDDEPFGAAVNAGARVMAKADGGEILVSEMVRSLAGTVPGIEYRDRGRHAFKGFDEPWRLYQLVWAGAPQPRPKPRRRPSRRLVLAAAAGAVGVAAVAGGVILATRDGNSGLRRLDRNSIGAPRREERPHPPGSSGRFRSARDRRAQGPGLGRQLRRQHGHARRREDRRDEDDPRPRPPDRDCPDRGRRVGARARASARACRQPLRPGDDEGRDRREPSDRRRRLAVDDDRPHVRSPPQPARRSFGRRPDRARPRRERPRGRARHRVGVRRGVDSDRHRHERSGAGRDRRRLSVRGRRRQRCLVLRERLSTERVS